ERFERDLKQLGKMKPYGAVHYILYGMGYLKYLKSQASKSGCDADGNTQKALGIKERAKGFRSHGEFLEAIDDYTRELAITMAKKHRAGIKGDAVTIMTYHASKGLEFKEVFLPGVNEGVIPGYRIITEKEMEEERRLFYVGMTRASERLNISYHRENLTGRLKPSRFLNPLTDRAGRRDRRNRASLNPSKIGRNTQLSFPCTTFHLFRQEELFQPG
ncbi:MAG: ATP-dependent helicase, partial [Lachnospiraceae bacterium]|nr:ATP-dependent helicase [Lachnospiraceae bacterium]